MGVGYPVRLFWVDDWVPRRRRKTSGQWNIVPLPQWERGTCNEESLLSVTVYISPHVFFVVYKSGSKCKENGSFSYRVLF